MSELEVALAQIFRKKGKASMSEKDFVFAVSLDFRWFSPKDAQKLLDAGMGSGLLVMEDGMVKPSFDHKSTEVPKGYAPGQEILQGAVQPKGMFMKIIDATALKTGMPVQDLISQANQTQDRMSVDTEVAALIVARDLGVDVSEFFDTVEEDLGKRYKK